jgi:hypothetical protein
LTVDARIARAVPLVAVTLICARAHAGGAPSSDDARALFDLPPPTVAATPSCATLGSFGCVMPTDTMEAFAPAAVGEALDASWLRDLPRAELTHDRLAQYAAGASQDAIGLFVPGASAIENRWLVEGAPADDIITGGAGTRVPLAFLASIDVTTGGFAARDRASTGAIVDAELRRGGATHEVEAAAWLTAGAPAHDVVDANYLPVTGAFGAQLAATAAVTAGGPAPVRGGWYFAGVQARVAPSRFTGTARRLVDTDDDGLPERDPDGALTTEIISTRGETATTWDVPFVARAGVARGAHDLALTVVGDWTGDTSFDPMATLSAGAVDTRRLTGDAIATWHGRWDKTRAYVQWAWHRDAIAQSAHDPAAAAIPAQDTAFVPNGALLPDDFALGAACDDSAADDPFPLIANCPVATGYFARGGAGFLSDTTADRPSVTASLAHLVGAHRLEAGVTGEDTRMVERDRFTGGVLERSVFGLDEIDTRFVELGGGPDTCDGAPCRFLDSATTTYRERTAAAWLEDTWRPDPRVAADVGVREEYVHVGDAASMHELLPRASLAWDPLGGGTSRVFAGFARTTPALPLALSRTIAGGPTTLDRVLLPGAPATDFLHPQPGTALAIGTSPMVVDNVTIGGEVAVRSAVRLGIAGQWRVLRRAIESDGTLITDVAALRDSGALTVQLATAPGGPFAMRLAYTYARAVGNWSGPADPAAGATFYSGPDFAGTPPVGAVPSDLGHRLIAEVVTSRKHGLYTWIVGGRAALTSGAPLGAVDGTGAVILARGTLGRAPLATAADIHVAVRRGRVEVGLDVRNVFDHRPPTAFDQRYSSDGIPPISGGDLAALTFARTDDGALPARNPNFGSPTAYLAPLTAVLYARAAY